MTQQYGGGPPSPGPGETRNLIIAVVLSGLILLGWNLFYEVPRARQLQAERARLEQVHAERQQQAAQAGAQQSGSAPNTAPTIAAPQPREQVLAASAAQRIQIATPSVDGSISLQGARIDDISLHQYCRSIADEGNRVCAPNDEVRLLQPINSTHGYDAFFGWEDRQAGVAPIGDNVMWTAPEGARLTPQTPVTLTYRAENGLEIRRTIAVDDNFMFTVTDEVHNTGAATRAIRPFGVVRREGKPEDYVNRSIVQQGFSGAFGPNNHLHMPTYQAADKHAQQRVRGKVGEDERLVQDQGTGGWLGISDHYWLAAIVLDQREPMSGYFDARTEDAGVNDYRAAYRGAWREIPAGGSISYTQRLFAGAKRVDLLRSYQQGLSIPRFDNAVDWGNLTYPLTRTFFLWLLHPLAKWVASLHITGLPAFGIAILLSTVVIKGLMFPLVYHSFKSMAKMRAILPKQKEIQERYAADKERQQQEMIRLYQTEKVNPVSGCLPMLLQIPVFFALYKTLSVTIEMRHAPFVGWVHDLSAPDPTTIFNLFGLLPFNPHDLPLIGAVLPLIGIWPVLYGVSMLALQGLSPPATDPTQAMIFRFMPILFTFLFAGFPAGLVIYWTWSNTLSIAQQYLIMRRQGVETQFDKFLHRFRKAESATPAS